MLSGFILYFYPWALRFVATPLATSTAATPSCQGSPGFAMHHEKNFNFTFPSAFRWFWHSAASGSFTLCFTELAEVEGSVSPVAELNAEIREGRLVRDATSHRGGPAADLISSSWLQRREDADLITARLSLSCGALSCVHGSSFFVLGFFSSQLLRRLLSSIIGKEASRCRSPLLMWVLIRGQRPDLALSPQRVS